MNKKLLVFSLIAFALQTQTISHPQASTAQGGLDGIESLGQEQINEKNELQSMRDEMRALKQDMSSSMQAMTDFQKDVENAKELHIFAREANWEIAPGLEATSLTYNGQVPGPQLRVKEGGLVRIVLHNQMKVPTSLYFHGMNNLPFRINGLAKQDAGLVYPGQEQAYEFKVGKAGTYWYHPQIVNAEQKNHALYGAIIVEPKAEAESFDKQFVFILGQVSTVKNTKTGNALPVVPYFIANGKTAPATSPIEVQKGDRVRLSLINAGNQVIPLCLTGHSFDVIAENGGMRNPPFTCDTYALNPACRVDLEFSANNPGVWSLASELTAQTTTNGKFPGGIAIPVKYIK
jgi:FtsP/CotA-like multicopper oxidase with cupredoxin domain